MATIAEMQSAIDRLINSDETIEIPGLDFESVIDNLVEINYKEKLDYITNPDERKRVKDELLEYYRTNAKQSIQEKINDIKSAFSTIKTQVAAIPEAVTNAVSSNALPSVITVGTATSTPNPAYYLLDNANKKNTLLSMIKTGEEAAVKLLNAAINICFQVPDTVMTTINSLTTVKAAVNSIPV